jgi:hypothetical protein
MYGRDAGGSTWIYFLLMLKSFSPAKRQKNGCGVDSLRASRRIVPAAPARYLRYTKIAQRYSVPSMRPSALMARFSIFPPVITS